MQSKGFFYSIVFAGSILAAGIACGAPAPTPAAQSTAIIGAPAQATTAPAANSGSLVTFTDQNKYFSIQVPGDWAHTQDVDKKNNYWYWDVIKSPDGHAAVESVVFDDGTPWTGTQNGKQALYMLNTFYSKTGKEGDIRISDDSIQPDKSERLTWTSKGGNYSGVSFFEVHGTAFLMFTTWWDNPYADQYRTVLDNVVSSYK